MGCYFKQDLFLSVPQMRLKPLFLIKTNLVVENFFPLHTLLPFFSIYNMYSLQFQQPGLAACCFFLTIFSPHIQTLREKTFLFFCHKRLSCSPCLLLSPGAVIIDSCICSFLLLTHSATFEFSLLAHILQMLLASKINSHISTNVCSDHQEGRWIIKALNANQYKLWVISLAPMQT